MNIIYAVTDIARNCEINIALDEVFFEKEPFVPIIRFYRWNKPAYTIGYFQHIAEFKNDKNYDLVRRLTGGLAVLHDDDLSYSFIVSSQQWNYIYNQEKTYKIIHSQMGEALKDIGINCDNKAAENISPNKFSCVNTFYKDDIFFNGKKIIGSCQRRRGKKILVEGSVHLKMTEEQINIFTKSFFKKIAEFLDGTIKIISLNEKYVEEADILAMNIDILYIITFFISCFLSLILTPFFRYIAIKFNIYDIPITAVKTHKVSTPYLGGLAIWSGCVISLIIIRFITNFPTGTLNNLRSVITGSFLLLVLGLFDDIKKGGLGFKLKFLIQIIACLIVVIGFDIRINFIENYVISVIISILWIIGISNAFNLIDIMDGLSCGTAAISSFFFFIIALPSEMIYVNFCSLALCASCLGFLPYNLSQKKKIFMGDTGSLSIGFILATIAMGTSYTRINPIAISAPLLILAVPIYETIFVSIMKIKEGKNPFLGSKDHFPLRLEKIGYTRKQILIFVYILSFVLGIFSYTIIKLNDNISYLIFLLVMVSLVIFSVKLSKIKME